MLSMITNHPILFRILFYAIPLILFFLGMFLMYKVKVKVPLNFSQMMKTVEHHRVAGEFYYDQFGITTNKFNEKLGRKFDVDPYQIYFVDRFGKSHEVKLAQMEDTYSSTRLTLYEMDVTKYDDKGKYSG